MEGLRFLLPSSLFHLPSDQSVANRFPLQCAPLTALRGKGVDCGRRNFPDWVLEWKYLLLSLFRNYVPSYCYGCLPLEVCLIFLFGGSFFMAVIDNRLIVFPLLGPKNRDKGLQIAAILLRDVVFNFPEFFNNFISHFQILPLVLEGYIFQDIHTCFPNKPFELSVLFRRCQCDDNSR